MLPPRGCRRRSRKAPRPTSPTARWSRSDATCWTSPLITAIVSYTFFGLDALSDELEDPFGRDVNDLPLDALIRTAEREIRAALGETVLPPALKPVNFVLQ